MKIIIPHNIDEQQYNLEKYNLGGNQVHLSCPADKYNLYKIAKEIKKEAENTSECLILIDENLYFTDGNAVGLVEMLRILRVNNLIIFLTPGASYKSCKLLDNKIDKLILSTNGIKLHKNLYEIEDYLGENDSGKLVDTCDDDHIRTFIEANFKLPEGERHNWANIWGIDRMKSAHNKLSECEFEESKKGEEAEKIDKSLNYQRALYLYSVSEDGDLWKENIDSQELIDFSRDRPRILYIDDQADCGWSDLFKHIIHRSRDTDEFISVQREEVTNDKKIIEMIQKHESELILLDLRLKNETGIYPNIDDLSGAGILKKIKKEYPGLPVVITTASNKQWTYSELRKWGADACWTKEGIDTTASLNSSGNDKKYCIENYLNFVKIIRQFQYNKEDYDLLRRLGELKRELEIRGDNKKEYWWGKNKWQYSDTSWGEDSRLLECLQNLETQCAENGKVSEQVSEHISSVFYLYFLYLQVKFGYEYEEIRKPGHWFSWILQDLGKILESIHRVDKIEAMVGMTMKVDLVKVARIRRDKKGTELARYIDKASHLKGTNIDPKIFRKQVYDCIEYIRTPPEYDQSTPQRKTKQPTKTIWKKGSVRKSV